MIFRLLGARSICLDVFGTDSKGRKFDLEIQRADRVATPQRARYHSSAIDIEFLKAPYKHTSYMVTLPDEIEQKCEKSIHGFEELFGNK